ncbi:MAG: glycosyltransferase family 39 protein [Candidatus Schekmanbacteria bacterium]|nr:glycosyltransferase family 39 protein [Candidatus Schekmanbacteria bacterium]
MQNKIKQNVIYGFLIASIFLLGNLLTIKKYGIDFDGGIHMSRGESLLHFYLTGEKDYNNLPLKERCIFQKTDPAFPFLSPEFFFSGNYTASTTIGGLSSAVTCRIFHKKLGWMNAVDAHNLSALIYGSLTILVIYLFALEAFGTRTALLSAVFLALYPLFIGYSHSDIKDLPVVFFVAATIWTFWRAVTGKKYKWLYPSFVLFGLALVSKETGGYGPIILLAWLLILIFRGIKFLPRLTLKLIISIIAAPLISIIAYVAFAPPMWDNNPITMWANTSRKVESIVTMKYVNSPAVGTRPESKPWRPHYPLAQAVLTVPLHLLLLSLWGGIQTIRRRLKTAERENWLVLIWTVAPVLFCMLPFLKVYDAIRQILPYIPGLCLLAGIGAEDFISRIEKKTDKAYAEKFGMGFFVVVILLQAFLVFKYHPVQTVFYNSLIGGFKGAIGNRIPFTQKVGVPDAGDTRGSSLRGAIEWVNAYGEPGSGVIVYCLQANKFLVDRQKLKLFPFRWNRKTAGDLAFQSVYIIFPNTYWNQQHPLYGYCYHKLKPLYSVQIDSVPVNFAFRMSREEFFKVISPR